MSLPPDLRLALDRALSVSRGSDGGGASSSVDSGASRDVYTHPIIEQQFARRGRSSERPADMPLTTAALEQLARPITAALYPRRYALKNRERLYRLLMLLQLRVNGQDDVQAYAKTIRSWLEANGGGPAARRRAIADPAGAPSLR